MAVWPGGKKPRVSTEQEAVEVPETKWTPWRKDKTLTPCRDSNRESYSTQVTVCACVRAGGFCNVCICEGFVMCGCFGNMYTVLWLRFFLTWLRFFLPWLRFFRAFSSVVRQNARVKLAKTGHGQHSSTLVVICVVRLLFRLFYVLFVCKCVLPPGDNPVAVNKYIKLYRLSYSGSQRAMEIGLYVSRRWYSEGLCVHLKTVSSLSFLRGCVFFTTVRKSLKKYSSNLKRDKTRIHSCIRYERSETYFHRGSVLT